MSKELTTQEATTIQNVETPQAVAMDLSSINQGTIAIEASRAVAEAQGKLVIAKRFPRNEVDAYARIMEACRRPSLAKKAFYSFPRGGQTIKGASIRFAEELARCWGNLDYGIKELSQEDGKSEMQAYCWDLETNTQSVQNFTSPHFREVNKKMQKLESQRDIYENNANMAARRLRARILAILPSDLVEAAIEECENTIKTGGGKPLIDLIKALIIQFGKIGVPTDMIEERLGKTADKMTGEEYVDYVGIYNSIKDKQRKMSDWFASPKEATDLTKAIKDEDGEK